VSTAMVKRVHFPISARNWGCAAPRMFDFGETERPAGVTALSLVLACPALVDGGGWPRPSAIILGFDGAEAPAGMAALSALPWLPVIAGGGGWFLPAVDLSVLGGRQPPGAVPSACGVSVAVAVPLLPAELGVSGLFATTVLRHF